MSELNAEQRIIVGAFICAAGMAVVTFGLVDIWEQWFPDGRPLHPLFLLPLLILAAIVIYRSVNPSLPRRLRGDVLRHEIEQAILRHPNEDSDKIQDRLERHNKREREAWFQSQLDKSSNEYLIAVGLLTLVAVLAVIFAFEARQFPIYDYYAAVLPEPASESASSLIVWSVKRDPAQLPAGIPAICLGGLFIAAFGIWFPKIGISGAGGSVDLAEKLLAPVLSIGLIAFGASQKAEATQQDNETKLAQQGLPPAVELPGVPSKVYPYPPAQLSPATIALLSDRISQLSDALQHTTVNVKVTATTDLSGPDAARINASLQELGKSLRNPAPTHLPLTSRDVSAMKAAISGLNQVAQTQLQQSDNVRVQHCNVLSIDRQNLLQEKTKLEAEYKNKYDNWKAYQSSHFYQRWFSVSPDDPGPDYLKLVEIQAAIDGQQSEYDVACKRT